MKKTLIALAAFLAVGSAIAHNQTLSNASSAGVSGSNSNYTATSATGNGLSISTAGQLTGGSAAAGSTVYTAPGFNNGTGTGTTGGTIAGSTDVKSVGYAGNVSVGGGTGSAGSTGNVSAFANASYDSKNNYVPLAVKQTGSTEAGASQISEVGRNGLAGSAAGSSSSFEGAGYATRLNPVGNLFIVSGQVADTKTGTSWAVEGGLGNVTQLGNSTGTLTNVGGCFKAKSTGATGGC